MLVVCFTTHFFGLELFRQVDAIVEDEIKVEQGICWFHAPNLVYTISYFLDLVGAENLHVYLWAAKDLSWMTGYFYSGVLFGGLAVIWSLYIVIYHAMIRTFNSWEIICGITQALWLLGNYIWMIGELHDIEWPNEEPLYDLYTIRAGYVLKLALVLSGVFVLIIKPLDILRPSEEALEYFNERAHRKAILPPFVHSWRDYENTHIFFWLGKDTAWNSSVRSMWVIFVIPTLLIAGDFVISTFYVKTAIVDHAHYVAVMLWVLGNIVWAASETFDLDPDTPYKLFSSSVNAVHVCRFWASWLLLSTYIPICMLYIQYFRSSGAGGSVKYRKDDAIKDEVENPMDRKKTSK